MSIKKTAIIGMGALGLLYGQHIQNASGKGSVSFVMDHERYMRNHGVKCLINGEAQEFEIVNASDVEPVDLIIVATKYNGLKSALATMKNLVNDNTIILSVMNGISSELIIADHYGDRNLIYCVAIGMDAMRDGNSLQYKNKGKLQIGIVKPYQEKALERLQRFFSIIDLPYSLEDDIMQALWGKFLLNVGINQTCMVFDTTYEGVLTSPDIMKTMTEAMQEVISIAEAEGVKLTQSDLERYIAILHTLKPDGYPSMRQDALARRRSEVELFAGTVLNIAAKHDLPVPVNSFYYQRIKEIESNY